MDNSQGKNSSRQVNPGGNGDGEVMMLTREELAEVKEVVGRLYKKITELEISQKSEREKDRAELKAWAQTNLIQTQLLGKQTAVIEILTTGLKTSERLSQQSETHSESLLTELQSLKSLLGSMPKSSPNVENLELKGLKAEVVALREALRGMPQTLEKVNQGQIALAARQLTMEVKLVKIDEQTVPSQRKSGIAGWNFKDWGWFAVVIFCICGLWIISDRTKTIQSVATKTLERAGWSNTKLERIEKNLGIKHK